MFCSGSLEVEETCKHARDLGCKSVELIDSKHWPVLKKYGLTCAISGIPVKDSPFIKGYNNPEYHDWLIKALNARQLMNPQIWLSNVIAFTGFSENFSKEDGAKNCIEGFKKVAGYAEKKGVTICLEMLNSRDDTDVNKGHPGYQGDHTDYCMEI